MGFRRRVKRPARLSGGKQDGDEKRDTGLHQVAAGVQFKLVGLVLEERGVLRAHQVVRIANVGEGEITSGSFSPTLSKSIALARVPMATADRAEVEIRGKWYPVRVVKPTFVRHGRILI